MKTKKKDSKKQELVIGKWYYYTLSLMILLTVCVLSLSV